METFISEIILPFILFLIMYYVLAKGRDYEYDKKKKKWEDWTKKW